MPPIPPPTVSLLKSQSLSRRDIAQGPPAAASFKLNQQGDFKLSLRSAERDNRVDARESVASKPLRGTRTEFAEQSATAARSRPKTGSSQDDLDSDCDCLGDSINPESTTAADVL